MVHKVRIDCLMAENGTTVQFIMLRSPAGSSSYGESSEGRTTPCSPPLEESIEPSTTSSSGSSEEIEAESAIS